MIFSKTLRASSAIVCAVAAATSVRPAQADTILKAGDRVVFYGDSITEQRLYTRYIQEYFYSRYPGMKVNFFNAGWGGDTTWGALSRIDRDVLYLKPTVVTLFFGMNDGGYTQTTDAITDKYRQNLEAIIKKLKAANVRVIVFTPGCVDPDKNPRLGEVHYNDNLAALGKAAMDLAKQYDCICVNVHDPMLAYQTAHKTADPKFVMIPDGVHPNPYGHLVMANIMLQAFQPDTAPAIGAIDVKTGKGTGLTEQSEGEGSYTFTTATLNYVPFWFEPGSAPAVKDSGLEKLVEQKLQVKGLPKGAYDVTVDGHDAGVYRASALSDGVLIPGSYSETAHTLHDLASKKENLYYTAWRDLRVPLADIPGIEKMNADLLASDNDLTGVIYTIAAKPMSNTINVTLHPGGTDLARGKSYDAVDPNAYNWGMGGLTDGSWEANSEHCFASGDKDAFPKTATIDLGQVSKIDTVVAGVPGFGATKTIEVLTSADGKTFTSVGSHTFDEAKEARFSYKFPVTAARYVRLSYPDHYADGHGYSANFVFTTECEVYGPEAP